MAAVDAEGRYILAEFSAHADTTIKFTASQKADSGDSWAASAERTISRDADGVYGAADATAQSLILLTDGYKQPLLPMALRLWPSQKVGT